MDHYGKFSGTMEVGRQCGRLGVQELAVDPEEGGCANRHWSTA